MYLLVVCLFVFGFSPNMSEKYFPPSLFWFFRTVVRREIKYRFYYISWWCCGQAQMLSHLSSFSRIQLVGETCCLIAECSCHSGWAALRKELISSSCGCKQWLQCLQLLKDPSDKFLNPEVLILIFMFHYSLYVFPARAKTVLILPLSLHTPSPCLFPSSLERHNGKMSNHTLLL